MQRTLIYVCNDSANNRVYFRDKDKDELYCVSLIEDSQELYLCTEMGQPIYHDKILITDKFEGITAKEK